MTSTQIGAVFLVLSHDGDRHFYIARSRWVLCFQREWLRNHSKSQGVIRSQMCSIPILLRMRVWHVKELFFERSGLSFLGFTELLHGRYQSVSPSEVQSYEMP